MKNVIFFSGTHGCGKTTTIEKISNKEKLTVYASSDGDHGNPYTDPFKRQIWRINKYYLDALEIQEKAKESLDFILADRCFYDHIAYTSAFNKLGWINADHYTKIMSLKNTYFEENLYPRNLVLFFPPLEWTIDRIKTRWNEEKRKWNEQDFDYLKILRDYYQSIFDKEKNSRNVLFVRETDLELRVLEISKFIENLRN